MSDKDIDVDNSDLTFLPAVSANDKSLANISYSEFLEGKYVECMQSIYKLVSNRPSDPKVIHNKAVIEYFLSDFKRTDEFKKNLHYVCSQANVNLEDVDGLDDVEHCVLYYNHAIMLYHLRQYHTALLIMDKVFQFIEPLDENLGKKVCFLLLELSIRAFQPDKALGMINFIESWLYEHLRTDANGKSLPFEKDEEQLPNKLSAKREKEMLNNDVYRPKLQQYKILCCLMVRSQKGCKRELRCLANSAGLGPSTVYLKANFEYMRGNYRKALKLINSAPSPLRPFAESGENVPMLFFNNMGCIHFYMGRPNLGYLYFERALQENESAIKRLSKPGFKIGSLFHVGVNGRPIYTVGANFRYELLYNMGIQLLHAKKPSLAFDCLLEAVSVFHTNPRLWLRLAECCIQMHQNDNEADFRLKEKKKEMIQGVVGFDLHRKILLSPRTNKPYQICQDATLSAGPVPTLEFAAVFLRNASVLLLEHPATSHQPSSGTRIPDEPDGNSMADGNPWLPTPPGNPIKGQDVSVLECSILAASAYVALQIGDIQMALHYAESLLAQPRLSGAQRFLGHLYAGEALLHLDRIADAVQHLNPNNVQDLSLTFTQMDREDNKDKTNSECISNKDVTHMSGWFPSSVVVARTVMQYNLTVAYTVRGELDKASDTLKQLNIAKGTGMDIPIQAMMLSMYIQMQLGHADVAKSMIHQNFPQYR